MWQNGFHLKASTKKRLIRCNFKRYDKNKFRESPLLNRIDYVID